MKITHQYMLFPGGIGKAVTFSYDDGCRADLRLAEMFQKYGLKASFNVCSDLIGKDASGWYLSAEEIRNHLINNGFEITVHGAMHRAPGCTRAIEGIRDVLDCRMMLEQTFGRIIRGMAYPNSGIIQMQNGMTYDQIRSYLAELGIVYARSLNGDNDHFCLPEDWYNWIPTAHHDNPEIMHYIDEFLTLDQTRSYLPSRQPKLLYIWGHSFEFDRNGNWDHMEEICRRVSHLSEVWYATNIEIHDYTEAYRSLIYSADGAIIYNPTLFEIWFCVDGEVRSIKPGETIRIG